MKPFLHARISAKKFGGNWQDYQDVHDFFDSSKAALADMRHRLVLHSDLGCEIAEQIFAGRPNISALCRQHQEDDLGRVVPLDEWLSYCSVPKSLAQPRIPTPFRKFRDNPETAAAERFGGEPEAYKAVFDWFRRPGVLSRHDLAPAVLGNAFGIMLSERLFGPVIETAPSRFLPTRDAGEAWVIGQFGQIPTLGQVLAAMKTANWMFGADVAEARKCAAEENGLILTD